ncbi:uncharacterized protein LOC131688059 [Topomyia yanbarensis]|uniref:uncharacterized protein LOC131688059 n=1 Tax=Topomyia yanbarensis TaxID=2498891 RepID=UPI00273BBF72|nr:uncharacterized protein LOC131688059 [Topomyia yanbarensis]
MKNAHAIAVGPMDKRTMPYRSTSHSATDPIQYRCHCCGDMYSLVRCPTFQQMSVEERLRMVNTKRLCSNCFRSEHWVRNCSSTYTCRTCGKKHHTMIHPGFTAAGSVAHAVTFEEGSLNSGRHNGEEDDAVVVNSSSVSRSPKNTQVLLSTVIVAIPDPTGKPVLVRALLDSRSQINICSERLCQILKMKRRVINVPISGVGQSVAQARYSVNAVVTSRVSNYSRSMSFVVLPSVTRNLPITNVETNNWNISGKLQLADPTFHKSGRIDMLLGAEWFYEFLVTSERAKIELGPNLPILINTVFGWIVSGRATAGGENTVLCHVLSEENTLELLEKFWQVEDLSDQPAWTKEETDSDEYFIRTFARSSEGRYVVKLPKRVNFENMLGDTAFLAFNRFQHLERRLSRDAKLKEQYVNFMQEYLELGHMRKVAEINSVSELNERQIEGCFLPHHPVIKDSSTTTKVRVVFDGSARTSSGYSLNDALAKGPVIQEELLTLLIRFRNHQVGLVADVEKMYRQVVVHPEDTKYQRIFWRFAPNEPVGIYELQTVTYGLTPSSFLATRALQQLAEDEKQDYPLEGDIVKKDFYVDDYIGGESNVQRAIQVRKELEQIMDKGGFKLRKWCSNAPEVLADIPACDLGTQLTIDFKLESGEHVKTLGITWEPATDKLRFNFSTSNSQASWSKRKILSAIASLFDPLGIAAPAKIFMQELAMLQVKWDEPLPQHIERQWNEFYCKLNLLGKLQVPRYAFVEETMKSEIHVFSDASEKAYGACLYIKSENLNKEVGVRLIAAKSRVAPLKRLTLPRLELCAAREAAKLYAKVTRALEMTTTSAFFWSDSTIVLQWIQSPPNTWKTFVGNRVSEIQTFTFGHNWNHVAGKDNPADLVSRGMNAELFLKSDLWQRGPEWISKTTEEWPTYDGISDRRIPHEMLEARQQVLALSAIPDINPLFSRFSSLQKLLRTVAYCIRFARNCRSRTSRITNDYLTVDELRSSKLALTRLVQQEQFLEDIKELRASRFVSCKSAIRLLKSYLDEDGILRVGGRLHNSGESYQTKHPSIIPKSHPFTKLIIEHYHRLSIHGGRRLTLSLVRQEFWPLHGKRAINSVLRICHRCCRANPIPVRQPFGQLPSARVSPSRPFSITGVDYCGPVYLKPLHRKAAPGKAYIAVFVCFSTKAVHLELATDLSTPYFLSALRRFVGHHGLPAEMHSDNGKNFAGAKNELYDLHRILNSPASQKQIATECAAQGIKWFFIPPKAPNFGGLWESAVRCTKSAIKRELGIHRLSSEDMQTLLVQIAAAMNSRPLTPLTDDPDYINVLTPAHFLIGTSMKMLPEVDLRNVNMNRLDHYKQTQYIFQRYWQRWRKEYLAELQASDRRHRATVIKPGSVVILCDEYSPPVQWHLARIIDVHPGPDGVVRVVTLRTSTGTYTRPVSKICLLPEDQRAETSQSDNCSTSA